MAARRIAKTSVDWAAFAERVPSQQKQSFPGPQGEVRWLPSQVRGWERISPRSRLFPCRGRPLADSWGS
ncbi:hypothetical protein MTO96_002127 [Rhipicephalus appendiculatus]